MSLRPVSILRAFAVGFGGAVLLSLTGCQQLADPNSPQITVIPSSDYGHMITNLYVLIFTMAAIVFVGVEGFLVYAIIRFRRRTSDEIPKQVHGNTRLEIAWTLLPALILLVILFPTISTIFASDAIPPKATQRIQVIAHQWWWEFRYPDLNIVTANELHLPKNETAVFELQSADVIHSFWFPKMGGKMDVIPARDNHLWFTPLETGEFYGQCVEFCGTEHANMRMRLFVDEPDDFARWAKTQASDAPAPVGATADRGSKVFQTAGCVACHTIRGTQAKGQIGPDLTHVGARKTIAAGILDNTAANMTAWISDTQKIKPGNKMVVAAPSPTDLVDLVAYLQSLR